MAKRESLRANWARTKHEERMSGIRGGEQDVTYLKDNRDYNPKKVAKQQQQERVRYATERKRRGF